MLAPLEVGSLLNLEVSLDSRSTFRTFGNLNSSWVYFLHFGEFGFLLGPEFSRHVQAIVGTFGSGVPLGF